MKNFYLIITAFLCCVMAYGQTAITINFGDIPAPGPVVIFDNITSTNPPVPTPGLNKLWDYAAYYNDSLVVAAYIPETDPFFTSNGIDFHTLTFKGLTSTLGYFLDSEIDLNTNGFFESGLFIDSAAFSLGAFTGNNSDSLIIPEQKQIFATDKTIIKFPETIGTQWSSKTRRFANFTLTVQAFGLNHAPGQHVYTTFRTDSIVGWGKMRVHTSNGPSIEYDVLMDKVHEYNADSFYLNGSPASPFLLAAFGVSQGQHTNEAYFYRFNRTGADSYPYLASFSFGNDATYTTLSDARINTQNLTTGTKDLKDSDYTTLVYPNPSNTHEINIAITGRDLKITDYSLYDLSGKVIQQGKVDPNSNAQIAISLNKEMANGNYLIILKDKEGRQVVSEQVSVQ